MPEGPEHFKAAQCINNWSRGTVFKGKIVKSQVNTKNPEIELDNIEKYTVSAKSRGKELMLSLYNASKARPLINTQHISNVSIKSEDDDIEDPSPCCCIVFQFGMSGCFRFTTVENLPKHAHLMFYTDGEQPMVLSYVDSRRFGKWRISEKFSDERGPDPVSEYGAFRKNILDNLDCRLFQRAICEVLHNQKYFNGIGNYLRAEILYRSGIPPFSMAFDVLKDLKRDKEEPKRKKKGNIGTFDFLEWCSIVPFEVCMLEGVGYDPSVNESDYTRFKEWLQCYCQPGMDNLIDRDKRTIWFKGLPGPLVPKDLVSRHQKKKIPKKGNTKIKAPKRKIKSEQDCDGHRKESLSAAKKPSKSPRQQKNAKTSNASNPRRGVRSSARLKAAKP